MSGLERLTPNLDRERHVDVLEPEAVDIEAARLLSDGTSPSWGFRPGRGARFWRPRVYADAGRPGGKDS
jgi:hypothetical protein